MTGPKPGLLTPEELRARFAGTQVPADPLDVVMPPGLSRWPYGMQEQLKVPMKAAGVLVPLLQRHDGLSVLLTQRASHLKHHAGQVSFPGGRMEAHDVDVRAAALRETHEEVGIEPHHIDVIGYLRSMPTITGFAVTPVVGLVRADIDLVIDKTEVEYAFEVPLGHLLDEQNDRYMDREWDGQKFSLVEFHHGGERIWGATAYMILALRQFLLNK